MPVSTAALITTGRGVLLVKRRPGGDLGGCWELPGGKVEPGETIEGALRRELSEELGVESTVGEVVATTRFVHAGQTFDLYALAAAIDPADVRLLEHDALIEVPLSRALSMDLAPSDRRVLEQLLGGEPTDDPCAI